jgi:site-specific recombinase XerD
MQQLSPYQTFAEITTLRDSWSRSLRASNRATKTQVIYLSTVDDFTRFLVAAGMPTRTESITREHVEAYIADVLGRCRPATASVRFRALAQFFRWAVEDGEITVSPMAKATRPIVPETLPRILSDDEIRSLVAACRGRTFEDRRDRAIFLAFIDSGARLSEISGLELDDVDLEAGILRVTGKNRRTRFVSIGATTADAIDRYLRLRRQHRHAARPALWLAQRGVLTPSGIKQVTVRRARQAGLQDVHPHAFRHTFAHALKRAGAADEIVMALGGWRSTKVMVSYGRTLASERAVAAHKALSPVDSLGL